MNMRVKNEGISIGKLEIVGLSRSSILLVGDSEVITTATLWDTPSSSLLFTQSPFTKPLGPGAIVVEPVKEEETRLIE